MAKQEHHPLDEQKVALAIGLFFSIGHFLWLLLLAAGFGEAFYKWILQLHGITISGLSIAFPGILNAVLLLVVTFIVGCVFGYILARAWNWTAQR